MRTESKEFSSGPIRVFVNPGCNYGTGLSRWESVAGEVGQRLGNFQVEQIRSPETLSSQVAKAHSNGDNYFVAAGGDGTVHQLLNAVLPLGDPSTTIGAVGLGSSNDFHKPFKQETMINGIPISTDFEQASPRDVIHLTYRNPHGNASERYCLINASIGLTAAANDIFNSHHGLIRALQRMSVDAAITAVALWAIFTYQDIQCRLVFGSGEVLDAALTNLGVIKNPHFAGSLCYDTPTRPDDGYLTINLASAMSLPERIGMLVDFYKHRFAGRPKRRSWFDQHLSVTCNDSFALEMDGEVLRTDSVEFKVIPKAVRCCP